MGRIPDLQHLRVCALARVCVCVRARARACVCGGGGACVRVSSCLYSVADWRQWCRDETLTSV
jgi:hypothetical protein